jgi:tryptophanyl-tRNA synthetase
VYAIHKLVRSEQELEKIYDEHRGNYKALKEMLIEDLDRYFAPMRAKYEELKNSPEIIYDLLEKGKHEAHAVSEAKMEQVRKAIGVTH